MPIAMHGFGVFAVFALGVAATVLLSEPSHDPHVWSGKVMAYVLLALSAAAGFISSISFGIASAAMRRFAPTKVALLLGAAVGAAAAFCVTAWLFVSAHTLSGGLPFLACAAFSAISPLAIRSRKG